MSLYLWKSFFCYVWTKVIECLPIPLLGCNDLLWQNFFILKINEVTNIRIVVHYLQENFRTNYTYRTWSYVAKEQRHLIFPCSLVLDPQLSCWTSCNKSYLGQAQNNSLYLYPSHQHAHGTFCFDYLRIKFIQWWVFNVNFPMSTYKRVRTTRRRRNVSVRIKRNLTQTLLFLSLYFTIIPLRFTLLVISFYSLDLTLSLYIPFSPTIQPLLFPFLGCQHAPLTPLILLFQNFSLFPSHISDLHKLGMELKL